MGLEAVLGRERAAVVRHRERQEVELDVRIAHARPAADEAAALEMVGGPEPVAARSHARRRAPWPKGFITGRA